jgi:hypothetical protein
MTEIQTRRNPIVAVLVSRYLPHIIQIWDPKPSAFNLKGCPTLPLRKRALATN